MYCLLSTVDTCQLFHCMIPFSFFSHSSLAPTKERHVPKFFGDRHGFSIVFWPYTGSASRGSPCGSSLNRVRPGGSTYCVVSRGKVVLRSALAFPQQSCPPRPRIPFAFLFLFLFSSAPRISCFPSMTCGLIFESLPACSF